MVILEEIDQRFFNSTTEAQKYINSALSMGTRSIFRVKKDIDDENDGVNVEKSKCQKLAMQIVDGLENGQNVNDLTLKLCYIILKEKNKMITIRGEKFENINDILSIDRPPLYIGDIQQRLWDEADDRGLDFPNLECLSFIANMNPCWQIEIS